MANSFGLAALLSLRSFSGTERRVDPPLLIASNNDDESISFRSVFAVVEVLFVGVDSVVFVWSYRLLCVGCIFAEKLASEKVVLDARLAPTCCCGRVCQHLVVAVVRHERVP